MKKNTLHVVAIIPARGGSVSVPLKNIKELNHRPLISYMVKAALAAKKVDRVIVSTDHEKIAELARQYGAEVPFKRPADISEDVPTEMVIQHAINYLEKKENYHVDIVVTLQATTPLVTGIDIDNAVSRLVEKDVDSVVSVADIHEYPWWMMRYQNNNFVPFMEQDIKGDITVRQNLPKLFIPNGGIYVTRRDVVMKESRIYGKRCEAYVMPKERSNDIDDILDFRIIESIIKDENEKSIKDIAIGRKVIGKDKDVFIIAEAGVNHNGSLKLAKKLVDAACEAGVDAVKFQTFKAENLVTKEGKLAAYQKKNIGKEISQQDMLKKLELSKEDFIELKRHCDRKGIIFLSTPHSGNEDVDFLDSIGMPAYKIGSGDLTNLPFLEYVAQKNKPVILSTGMANLDEIDDAISSVRKFNNQKIIVLHCTTNYPCKPSDVNLNAMKTIEEACGVLAGYSDHTEGIMTPLVAVSMGAAVIEKHFTLDKTMDGPDHKASLEPAELKEMANQIKNIHAMLGSHIKTPTASEKEIMLGVRKSLVAARDLKQGHVITKDDIAIKRPGTGIRPKLLESLIGKKIAKNIQKDKIIGQEDFK
jgi:N,N'-diacetyllegionaminate synthase